MTIQQTPQTQVCAVPISPFATQLPTMCTGMALSSSWWLMDYLRITWPTAPDCSLHKQLAHQMLSGSGHAKTASFSITRPTKINRQGLMVVPSILIITATITSCNTTTATTIKRIVLQFLVRRTMLQQTLLSATMFVQTMATKSWKYRRGTVGVLTECKSIITLSTPNMVFSMIILVLLHLLAPVHAFLRII